MNNAMPGTFQWAEETKAKLRARHKIGDDKEVGLKWRTAEIKADGASDPQAFTARISTAALDRDNEVLLPTGADLREFDKSGAGFFNHDYSRLPVFIPGPGRRASRRASQ